MGKSAKRKRMCKLDAGLPTPSKEAMDCEVEDLDLQITLDFLSRLDHSQLLTNPNYKSLRKTLYSISNTLNPNVKGSQKVSNALEMNAFDSAVMALAQMRAEGCVPKLGSVQRWVRSAASATDQTIFHTLLDAIIRTADPSQVSLKDDPNIHPDANGICRYPSWTVSSDPFISVNSSFPDSTLWKWFLIETEKSFNEGTHLQILGHAADSIRYDTQLPSIQKIHVPFVQGAFVLKDALTRSECAQFIQAADSIGFSDASGYSFSADISIGSAGCVWLVDSTVLDPLFERVKSHLPQSLNGLPLTGINARFRFYKYSKGAEYRPHIDGSWPGSGVVDGKYQFDAFGDQWSCLTLLIYLNEGFEGGNTTFFWPSTKQGILNARGIVPKAGTILVFPHGNTSGALLHEGSSVLNGYKYVIRTDVLYKKAIE